MKLYQPDEHALAVSTPLWSPSEQELVFTVARAAPETDDEDAGLTQPSEAVRQPNVAWDAAPTGRLFYQQSIVYSCFFQKRSMQGSDSDAASVVEPRMLFDARCDHVGYVAANLAVRWHPDGKRIVFVDQVEPSRHSLFEFDLATQTKRRLLPDAYSSLLFDWSPQGHFLSCLAVDANTQLCDLLVWSVDDEHWRPLAKAFDPAGADSEAMLERLRRARPVWRSDESSLVLVQSARQSQPDQELTEVVLVSLPNGQSSVLLREQGSVRDLHWHPLSDELGFVDNDNTLQIVNTQNKSLSSRAKNVRGFAGWSYDGSQLSYTTAQTMDSPADNWALLLSPISGARDNVVVASDTTESSNQSSKRLLADMRITFPHWSPSEHKLSLWATFTPTHRSWFAFFLPWALMPGDPAVVLDTQTGQLSWMPVHANEEAQVGHYYLLQRDYETAWRWYERSMAQRVAPAIKLSEATQFLQQSLVYQDSTFFEFYCLQKLGRHEAAEQKLQQFRQRMTLDPVDAAAVLKQWYPQNENIDAELQHATEHLLPVVQDAYIAEVWASLNAMEDGKAFFERQWSTASSAAERLAHSLYLSQMHLLANSNEAYAEQVLQHLLPELLAYHRLETSLPTENLMSNANSIVQTEQRFILASGYIALLPLMSPEFVASLSPERLMEFAQQLSNLHGQASDDELARLMFDWILLAILRQDPAADLLWLEMRIDQNPNRTLVPTPNEVKSQLEQVRLWNIGA